MTNAAQGCASQTHIVIALQPGTHAQPSPATPRPHCSCTQVDDRLAGEGTGKILGINDPALFWAISIVFATVWGVFYVSTRCVSPGAALGMLGSPAMLLHPCPMCDRCRSDEPFPSSCASTFVPWLLQRG